MKNVTANDLETSYILFLSQLCNIQNASITCAKINLISEKHISLLAFLRFFKSFLMV